MNAQNSADSSKDSHAEMNLSYQSNDVYNGRKDLEVIPLITPRVSYIFKNGFQADASIGYDLRGQNTNQFTLDGSYTFSPGQGNYTGSFTASKFIYDDRSGSTTGEQTGSLELDNSYDFNFVEPGLDISWTFGGGNDFGASFSLQHEFDADKNKVSFIPNISVNAGTQNYYNSYYHNRRYRVHKKNEPPIYEEVIVYGDVLNANEFQILDYEITLPVNYAAGKWTFNFTPTYALPVHPADIRLTISYQNQIIRTRMIKEALSNSFYAQFGITYDF